MYGSCLTQLSWTPLQDKEVHCSVSVAFRKKKSHSQNLITECTYTIDFIGLSYHSSNNIFLSLADKGLIYKPRGHK
ncbi:hypothetical protein XENTR_v10014391 [Xenopus tropicalis]|nr:hypothetical protein XENTR_v10014391 [Xenopus tropicalis]